MITVDDRTGSADLAPMIRSLGDQVTISRLEFGDISFTGLGLEGVPQLIGIEVKTVGDVLNCINNGRFSGHQLPGLIQSYNYVWLIVEGEYRCGEDGLLEVSGKGGFKFWRSVYENGGAFMHRAFEHWLMTISIIAGVRVSKTRSRDETALFIHDLYRWWSGKAWDEHKSHLPTKYAPQANLLQLSKPQFTRRVAMELPQIGYERSSEVVKLFPTVADMVLAEEDEWRQVSGVGKKTAKEIVKVLRGGKY